MSLVIVLLLALAGVAVPLSASLVPHCSPHPAVLGLTAYRCLCRLFRRREPRGAAEGGGCDAVQPELEKAVAALTSA